MQKLDRFLFKFTALLLLALPFAVSAEEASRSFMQSETTDISADESAVGPREPKEPGADYVEIEIVYGSAFPGQIQVRDNVCTEFTDIECEKADIKVNSEECKQDGPPPECKDAKALLDSKF